jgi:hypothetical protein
VETVVGRGTTFTMWFPAVDDDRSRELPS